MDLMYSVSRKLGQKTQSYADFMDLDDELKGLIRMSQNNIAAWVTRYNLDEPSDLSLGSRVYIADMNIPWNYHKITTNDNIITLLEWDLHGEQLLIGDDSGTITIWSYKDYIFNEWICTYSTNLIGECMIAGAFFHTGRKMSLNLANKESVHYYERFSCSKFDPTVRMLGGTAVDGWFCITSTGLLVAGVATGLPMDLTGVPPATTLLTDSLSTMRSKICVVDVAYSSHGQLVVATSCANYKMPVKCYEVKIGQVNRKYRLTSQPMAGLFVNGALPDNGNQNWKITQLKFAVRDVIDTLIVAVNCQSFGVIQLWELSEMGQNRLTHMLVNGQVGVPNTINSGSLGWSCRNTVTMESEVQAVCGAKLLMSPGEQSYVMVILKNNRVKALQRTTLREEFAYSMDGYWDSVDVRKTFSNITLVDGDVSLLGCAMLVLDNVGNFYVLQIQQKADLNGPMTLAYATQQLEFCLISGYDFWDLAVQLKSHMLESVCDRLSDNFSKQLVSIQQVEYDGFLSMKASLYRMSSSSAQKHDDLVFLLSLHSIAVAFKSLLRPTELIYSDKGPGDNLSFVLSESVTDVNSVIVNIEPKEFTVEQSTLQSLQQLIQWVANLALNILSRIPEHRKESGYDIVTDNQALNVLREVLVIIRIWGLIRPNCLPIFVRNVTSFDGLSTIFRLISRLVQCNSCNDYDETFIDECYLLRNQVTIPCLSSSPYEMRDIASPTFFLQRWPLRLYYGQEPAAIEAGGSGTNTDIIRHVYLGDRSARLKKCNRCDGKTQTISACKSAAIRSWQNRWLRACLCGGKWRFIKTNRNQTPYTMSAQSCLFATSAGGPSTGTGGLSGKANI